jgi:hypothetical protein
MFEDSGMSEMPSWFNENKDRESIFSKKFD